MSSVFIALTLWLGGSTSNALLARSISNYAAVKLNFLGTSCRCERMAE